MLVFASEVDGVCGDILLWSYVLVPAAENDSVWELLFLFLNILGCNVQSSRKSHSCECMWTTKRGISNCWMTILLLVIRLKDTKYDFMSLENADITSSRATRGYLSFNASPLIFFNYTRSSKTGDLEPSRLEIYQLPTSWSHPWTCTGGVRANSTRS